MIKRERLDLCKSVANYESELARKIKAKEAADEAKKIENALNMLLLICSVSVALKRKKRWYEF